MNARLTITVAVSVLLLAAAVARLSSRNASPGEQSWTKPTIELVEALRAGGLPAAAALVGHYVAGDDGDTHYIALDIFDLAQRSSVVVLGRVTGKLDAKMYGSRSILTDLRGEERARVAHNPCTRIILGRRILKASDSCRPTIQCASCVIASAFRA